ncbi:MAG: oxidoreductase [Bdellovibrionales bacterium RIFOXYD1_FULL_53_11]|nr:MAG: oxidoreductase [Bdellovibrionales bacterium RIFOXYD1_FULL_53_11]
MEYQTTSTLLTWMTFLPMIGAGLIIGLVILNYVFSLSKAALDNVSRAIAFVSTLGVLLLAVRLWAGFDGNSTGMQFVHHFVWMRQFNIEYFMGVDGISITMVLLTALITFVAMIASVPWWGKIEGQHFTGKKVPGYMVMFLLLETGMLGTFCALDFFQFYIFWELMLLPMYFLIGIWGGPRKEYAAIKFFLYTLAGSVLMLLCMIGLYYASGPSTLVDGTPAQHTFNIMALSAMGQAGFFAGAAPVLGFAFSKIVFVGLFIGFSIKVPMFPFHTWLPDAHVEAPTPISVILAGILLKMGAYGMLRFNFQMLPDAANWAAHTIAVFGMINIVYAAFVCLAQKDLKKMIAYSSVSHMGFVLLGMAAMTPQGITGAVFTMVSHGLISPMLFLIAGVIYDRAHTRDIEGFGGLAQKMPEYSGIMGLAFMASLGLPGLAGFIGEFLVFAGAFVKFRLFTVVSATAVIITAAYYLWTIQRMFLGKLNDKWSTLWDLNWRERITLYPLGVMVIIFGFYPLPVFDLMNKSLHALMDVVCSRI